MLSGAAGTAARAVVAEASSSRSAAAARTVDG
jgi:hypothetical protein